MWWRDGRKRKEWREKWRGKEGVKGKETGVKGEEMEGGKDEEKEVE